MTLSKGMLILLTLLLVSMSQVWGISGARLIGRSESGRTALLNLGVHDGVIEGDYGVVIKQIRDLNSRDLRVVPVAKVRNIKVSTHNSIWILYRLYDPKLLKVGDLYQVITESEMLIGRKDPQFGRLSVVTEQDKVTTQVKHALADDKDRLAKLKHLYPELEPIHPKEVRTDLDGKLVDVLQWKKVNNDKYPTALYKSPHSVDFQRELNLSTFEKMVTAYLKQVNDPGFNYDAFYDQQKKETFSNEFRTRSNFSTEYEQFLSREARKAVEDAKLYQAVLEKGKSWSEDFSDEELRVILKEVSVLREKDRRDFVQAEPNRYAVFLGWGLSFTDAQSEKDFGYRRDGRYSVDFDFEGTPFLGHRTLEKFTLFGGLRVNRTAIESENINARVDEVSMVAGANWYPLYPPHAQEAPAFFIGTYVRSGTASVEAPTAEEKSNYTVLALPGFRGGMKYNFKNNVGLRIALSMETLTLDRYEQSKFEAVLPDRTSLFEGKMNFALAYSF